MARLPPPSRGRGRRGALGVQAMTATTSAATCVHQYWRADQRYGVGEVSQADRGGRLCGGAGGGAQPGRERRADPRRQHGRGPARFREGDGDVPEPDRLRARHRPRADHDRLIEVVGDRGGPQVRAGQGHRQLHQHEGGRGGVPRARQEGAALRRGRGRDGVRRAGPGRHRRAQGVDLRAGLQAADREGGLSARGHHLRSQHLRGRHRHRGAQRLWHRLHRGDAADQGEAAARARLGRRVQPVVLVPRQRGRAPGHALGVPLSRHRRRPRHGDRQCRPDHHLRRHRAGAARAVRGRDPQPAARRHRPAAGGGRALQGRDGQGQGEGPGLARCAGRGAAQAFAGARHQRVHRGRHGGRAQARRQAHRGDRGAADGRHERGRRPVRGGQDVPAAGGQVGARHEAGRGLSATLPRGGEEGLGARPRSRRPARW